MPFSFIEVEERKTKLIAFLFVVLFAFYFLTVYLVLLILEHTVLADFAGLHPLPSPFLTSAGPSLAEAVFSRGFFPPIPHLLWVFGAALMFSFLHWSVSTANLIEKISCAIGAAPADVRDAYHQVFKNIVDEVGVAIGGRPIEAMVIASSGMNAFALEDFNRRAVIGVTEGLLSRLSRPQIEAVVGHEAGHIANGDCLSTTVTSAMAELYDETLNRIKGTLTRVRGRGGMVLVLLYVMIGFMRFLSNLLRYFISRQREYRADAAGVRLTRDPLSLAEALGLIARRWRGEGSLGEKIETIFIMNPRLGALDEREGFWADLFSTHPPVGNRVRILLDMAHLDETSFRERLENFRRVSPVAAPEFSNGAPAAAPGRWLAFLKQEWVGPFHPDEMKGLCGFTPETWVKGEGGALGVRHAYEVEELLRLFRKEDGAAPGRERFLCPRCRTSLEDFVYEGAPVLKCVYCGGVFTQHEKTQRILIRSDKEIPAEAARMGEVILRAKDTYLLKKQQGASAWILDCPECRRKMHRQFFVYAYPLEVDVCGTCGGIWFERLELEVLQYLYEHKEKLF